MAASEDLKSQRKPRWFFGGISSAIAACITHPLDLMKVHLQTQAKKQSLTETVVLLYRSQGIIGFYNGISASLARQLTYSTVRFGIYDVGKRYIDEKSVSQKVMLAGIAGTVGGTVGVPTDMVNVRMQNDIKLPPEKRRKQVYRFRVQLLDAVEPTIIFYSSHYSYKHVVDGLARVYREEGFKQLFVGTTTATTRATLMTIGQNVVYDQTKSYLITLPYFDENIWLHFTTALIAGGVATVITQPMDVLKTRMMNAKPGEYSGLFDVIVKTAKTGPMTFFKGIVPAFVRLGPQTILVFVIMEQFRMHFGFIPKKDS